MTGDAVDVWLIGTDLPDQVIARLEPLLDDRERQRAAGFALAAERRRFVAARGATRMIIAGRLGAPPAELAWRHGPHGKPELAGAWTGAQLSLSHSGELAALAVTGARRVGVDIQRLPARVDVSRMAARFYPPAEARYVLAAAGAAEQAARFTRLWTRKEACVKVTGGRLIPGLALPAAGSGPVLVSDPGGPLPGPYLVRDVPVPSGFRAAVALEGALPYELSRHWWPGE
jgi:4'-phosphopantetheinyl transferase